MRHLQTNKDSSCPAYCASSGGGVPGYKESLERVWGVYNHDFLHMSRVGSAAVPPTGMTNMSQPHWLLLLHTRLESKGNVDKFREMHNKLVWNSS